MLAASLPSRLSLRQFLRQLDDTWRFSAAHRERDYVRAPASLAFTPGVRARRMMRAARHGAC